MTNYNKQKYTYDSKKKVLSKNIFWTPIVMLKSTSKKSAQKRQSSWISKNMLIPSRNRNWEKLLTPRSKIKKPFMLHKEIWQRFSKNVLPPPRIRNQEKCTPMSMKCNNGWMPCVFLHGGHQDIFISSLSQMVLYVHANELFFLQRKAK